VGEMLFPEGDFSHDAGIAMTVDGAGFLGGLEATAIHQIVYSWRPDVDGTAADRSIADQGFNAYTAGEGLVPAAVSNLGEVRGIPVMLAGMVMLLGVFTLVHALGQTTRTRRREVGTIRALGLTRPTCRRVVLSQGTAIISVALAAGIPLGLIGGRQVWSLIAQRAHVIDRAVPGWVGISLHQGTPGCGAAGRVRAPGPSGSER
jgi:hypothetical protein